MFKKAFTCIIFLLVANLHAQELLPFVENFTKSEYTGDNQVWSISQGNDNALYFANNHFFLRYNGVNWEKYTLPNKTIIRCVFVDGDKIYTGSYKEFGYWKRISGKMKYFSISKDRDLFKGVSENEEIWKIFSLKNKIYFQSFNEIFTYENGHIEKTRFPFQISYCYPIGDEIYVASVHRGVYLMKGKTFEKKDNWSAVEGNVIHHIEKYDGKIYIFTKTNGVYVEDNGVLVPWKHILNEQFKDEVIVTAKFANDQTLIVGTGLQGLYIINLKDGSYKNLNRENSIRNNAVLSIALDKENDLWLGLDNGIAHVEINSSINIFSDTSGILGSVYCLATISDGYIFVTNHGAFRYKDKQLAAIPNSQGQVWDIYQNRDKYILGHNDGTFIYDGTGLQKVNPVSGGWKFFESKLDHVYFQANYSGIAYYKDINDLSDWKILDGLTKPIRNIAQNKSGELWAADNYRSLYRIVYDQNFKTRKIENVSQNNGIKNDYGVKIFTYKNSILFLIDKAWYTYNSTGKLVKDVLFNTSFKNISDIIPIDDEHFIVINSGLLYVISQEGNEFIWQLIPEKYYESKVIFENTKAYKVGNTILLNLDDGFIAYQLNENRRKPQKIYVEGFYQGNLITDETDIKYNQTVEINAVAEYYGYNRPDLFYRLNNSKDFIRIKNGSMVLNNLNSGSQKLQFYYYNGRNYLKIAEYRFDVSNPWYFSVWMIFFYVLIISSIFFLYYKWNKLRYIQKLTLKEEELKHQKQILEIALKAENELNTQEYEKHILELEIQAKSSEVAGKSFSIAKQGEIMDSIKKILDSETDINRLKSEIKRTIRTNTINKHEWEAFEKNMKQIHNAFISRLIEKYPNLSSKDIKLSIYLKMNLSSKEIAPLMNISFRGVELHRYRLRKKLGVAQEINLNKFMLDI